MVWARLTLTSSAWPWYDRPWASAALVGGGFLTLFPRVLQVHAAFKTLQTTNAGLAGGLGKVARPPASPWWP
jgi:hypothetical protein